jgi:hypothetical protein
LQRIFIPIAVELFPHRNGHYSPLQWGKFPKYPKEMGNNQTKASLQSMLLNNIKQKKATFKGPLLLLL